MENKKAKVILVFGGVYSSLGKGVAVSSIGKILRSLGNTISMIKFDPYLNFDPGNMDPEQHGEVYVTKDGIQTDLDLGTYERFVGKELTTFSTTTSGKIYNEIIQNARQGKYGGKTVQVVPHVTNAIKGKIHEIIKNEDPNFVIVEIGGTIGDAESIPYIEALSQFSLEYGAQNILTFLLSPLIMLGSTSGELKTKPTQHAIRAVRSLGISPAALILRSGVQPHKDTFQKLSLACHINKENIFVSPDLDLIYELPVKFYKQGIHKAIYKYFDIPAPTTDTFEEWINYIKKVKSISKTIKIALIGRYCSLHDAYASIIEAVRFAGYIKQTNIKIKWIEAQKITSKNIAKLLNGCKGVIIADGYGALENEGQIVAIKYIRENNIPILGISGGMQLMIQEYCKNVINLEKQNPISLLDGELRLGNQKCNVISETLAEELYQNKSIVTRHRHMFALTDKEIIDRLNNSSLKVSMISKFNNKQVVEFIENKTLSCYIGTQYDPQFACKPDNCDPVFTYLINKALIN